MFQLYNHGLQKFPIKVWLEAPVQIESGCLQQAINLSNLPFLHKWVALMPDTHEGFGMPIGGVIAVKGVIIPNAVGVDIGCGMAYLETNLHKSDLTMDMLQTIVGNIMRDIPTGFSHHKKRQECRALERFKKVLGEHSSPLDRALWEEVESGYYQVGTLGGGNHFIELQEDEQGMVCIMIHSGSRNFGYKIARHFNEVAKELNRKMSAPVPREYDLAFLPVDTAEGQSYVRWMDLALDFARENRDKMLLVVKDILVQIFPRIEFHNEVNAHHNYAALENHYGEDVWVHRKGAIRVRKGEMGIVPGAMGSFSYIVEGLGNPESFYSCSHGAGRKMGRKEALREIPAEKTMADLKELGVVLGKQKKADISEESRFAYKDIDFVISQELDLVKPVKKLKTLAVVKG